MKIQGEDFGDASRRRRRKCKKKKLKMQEEEEEEEDKRGSGVRCGVRRVVEDARRGRNKVVE